MAKEQIRVLVVDDTVTYRKIVSDVLTEASGIEVVGTAPNGKIALQKIDQLHPDLITLDLEMPVMDGLEVLRRLTNQSKRVGVIMLSAFTTEGAKSTMQALSLGAFDFVVKPSGGSIEENVALLRGELCPKIEAYIKTRPERKADSSISGESPSESIHTDPTFSANEELIQRMNRISAGPPATPEIVGIGISTGGPQSLIRMLPGLPGDFSLPILIVQHMPPLFTKSLADDLDKKCSLPVREARHEEPLRPGEILIAPGGRQMKVQKTPEGIQIAITDDPPENSCRPSVDYLFRSIAYTYQTKALGVIMTGMGSDGTLGCRLLKRSGGLILAQDASSCVVYGMPRQPIEDGLADAVEPLDTLAEKILELTRQGTLCI